MPTKRELLEEKRVKELRRMAGKRGLPIYSRMNKSELVETISKKYKKKEIVAWSKVGGKSGGKGKGAKGKTPGRRWFGRSIPLWLVLLIVIASAGVSIAAIGPVINKLRILPVKEEVVKETDIKVASQHFRVTGTGIASNPGTEAARIEFGPGPKYPEASTGAGKGDYVYLFDVVETAADALGAGDNFNVDVYGDDAFIGTIYLGQATVDSGFEGVECTVSVGREIQNIDIIITKQE